MHTAHGDIHEIGLVDGCSECFDQAEKPWSTLDKSMLQALIERNYNYRFHPDLNDDRHKYRPRSATEAQAMAKITTVMERIGKLMSCDPMGYIETYLQDKWGQH